MYLCGAPCYLSLIELQAIDTNEKNIVNTKDFQPQNVCTHPILITYPCENEPKAQFHTPDIKATQGNLDTLETLPHSPHDIVHSKSSGKNAKSLLERETSCCVHNGACIYNM